MALSTINVVIIQNNAGTITTSTVTAPLPPALIALDSPVQGNASQQTGFSAVDIVARNIFRAGGFTDMLGTFYPREVIQKITVS